MEWTTGVVDAHRRILFQRVVKVARWVLIDFAERNPHARLFAVDVNAAGVWQGLFIINGRGFVLGWFDGGTHKNSLSSLCGLSVLSGLCGDERIIKHRGHRVFTENTEAKNKNRSTLFKRME